MPEGHDTSEDTNVPPAKEPAATPLISAKQVATEKKPVYPINEERFIPLAQRADRIAENADYDFKNCLKGLVGEDITAKHLGIREHLNTHVIPDGGDGGVDLTYRGATIDVKTVGRQRHEPALTVDEYEPLTADYYVLASRVGKMDVRLIGYAPRQFVANAPVQTDGMDRYRIVEQEYLFPIPRL